MKLERTYIWFWNTLPLPSLILANYAALIYLNPHNFQRLGTIWICFAVLVIARFLSKFASIREDIKNLQLRVRVVAAEKQENEQHGAAEQELIQAKTKADLHVSSLIFCETLVLCVATLQTGYGDLFHCWINGKGWTTC